MVLCNFTDDNSGPPSMRAAPGLQARWTSRRCNSLLILVDVFLAVALSPTWWAPTPSPRISYPPNEICQETGRCSMDL